MKNTKPLIASLLIAGLVTGGAGVASAQYGGDADESVETSEVQTEQVENDGLIQTQVEGDDTDGDDDGEREGRRGNRGRKLSTAAETIGITVEELRAELQDGATIAEVAEANGSSADAVIDAMIANLEEKLDAKVEEGRLTAEEAAEKLESKTERISNKVNGIDNDDDDNDEEDTDASA